MQRNCDLLNLVQDQVQGFEPSTTAGLPIELRIPTATIVSWAVIDLHSHILPGLDDAPQTLEDALEMARDAVADGITASPPPPLHARADYPTDPAEMEQRLAEVRQALADNAIPLEAAPRRRDRARPAPGALRRDAPPPLGLGGSPRHLLVEPPDAGWPLNLEQTVFELELRGFAVVLAHPERNDEVQESPHRLERLVEMGVLGQVTASSVDGRLGPRTQKTALRLVELGFGAPARKRRARSEHPPGRPVGRGAGARRRRALRALADAGRAGGDRRGRGSAAPARAAGAACTLLAQATKATTSGLVLLRLAVVVLDHDAALPVGLDLDAAVGVEIST